MDIEQFCKFATLYRCQQGYDTYFLLDLFAILRAITQAHSHNEDISQFKVHARKLYNIVMKSVDSTMMTTMPAQFTCTLWSHMHSAYNAFYPSGGKMVTECKKQLDRASELARHQRWLDPIVKATTVLTTRHQLTLSASMCFSIEDTSKQDVWLYFTFGYNRLSPTPIVRVNNQIVAMNDRSKGPVCLRKYCFEENCVRNTLSLYYRTYNMLASPFAGRTFDADTMTLEYRSRVRALKDVPEFYASGAIPIVDDPWAEVDSNFAMMTGADGQDDDDLMIISGADYQRNHWICPYTMCEAMRPVYSTDCIGPHICDIVSLYSGAQQVGGRLRCPSCGTFVSEESLRIPKRSEEGEEHGGGSCSSNTGGGHSVWDDVEVVTIE